MCTQNNMDNTNNIPQNIEYMCVWTPQDIFLKLSGNNSFTKKHKTTPSLGQRKAVRDFLYTVFLTENLLIRSMNCEF